MAQYGKVDYWEERYTRDSEPFDWYQRWAGLRDVLEDQLQKNFRILVIGCGNSRLSEEMYEEGYRDLTNIDISSVVIKAMQEKYADKPGMTYSVMNVLDMKEFADGQFDCVIDKGTMDSILCGEGSTNNVQTMLKEISRVLKASGVYVAVSYGQPSYRLTYLQKQDYSWSVKINTVQKPMMGLTASTTTADEKDNVHYVYICSKGVEGAGHAAEHAKTAGPQ